MTAYENRPGHDPERLDVVARDTLTVPDVTAVLAEVDRDTDDWWKSCALAGVRHLAALGGPFTAHDVAALGVPEPDHPARWGALFNSAAHAGVIVAAGVTRSSRPTVHRSLVRQWVGGHPAREASDAEGGGH